MQITHADQYFLKAQDHFWYDIESAIESLQYALSYDPEHARSHYLMGMVFLEKMRDFDKAYHCFKTAIFYDAQYGEPYFQLFSLLIRLKKYEEVESLLTVAAKYGSISKVKVLCGRALLYEDKGLYKQALQLLKEASTLSKTQEETSYLDVEKERILSKKKQHKNTKQKSSKK